MNDDQLKHLALEVGDRLTRQDAAVTVAESCTGGWIAKTLTDAAGASAWFSHGWVCYSNEAKRRMLGVPDGTLSAHGAVSRETVLAMAAGARDRAGCRYACAVSGIAGPTGGGDEKPVGLVWVAWADGDTLRAQRFQFGGDREQVRRHTVAAALEGLCRR